MGTVELLVMLGMIAFNSLFAAYEIALAAVTVSRLKSLVTENRGGAAAALYMKENVEASLAAIQLGITLFGAIAAATGGAGAEEQLAPHYQRVLRLTAGAAEFLAVATVVVPLTAITILFGELVPKVFALRNKEWVCLRMSPAMRWFTFSVWPAVWLFETLVTAIADWGQRHLNHAKGMVPSEAAELQELRAVAAMARTSRLIGPREEGIILGAARLSIRPVSEIVLPASAISMLEAGGSLTDALIKAHLDMHTRFPVTEQAGDPQRIVGYVNVKDIVACLRISPQDGSLRGITRSLPSFAASDTISTCLEGLLREGAHIALVRDEAGGVLGMVTLEDVVEELLGDIKDEYDRLPTHVTRIGSGWLLGGGVSLARVKEVTGFDLERDGQPAASKSLNDWLAAQLGRPAHGGDVMERGALRVLVRKVRRQLVLEALLTSKASSPGPSPSP